MPIYDFNCRACGHAFEALVRAQDPAPRCPACQSENLERLLSGFAVSTREKRQAAALSSRKRQVSANKDKVIADEDYRKEHEGQ